MYHLGNPRTEPRHIFVYKKGGKTMMNEGYVKRMKTWFIVFRPSIF